MYKNIICNNCGKQGHIYYQCKLPIISYGLIVYREVKDIETNEKTDIEYLMIRRKHSFGYIDFIKGKYTFHSYKQLQNTFDEMSLDEKTNIKILPFEELWRQMCGKNKPNEELASKKKYDMLKNGIHIHHTYVNLEGLIIDSTTEFLETEWEFPKGKKNNAEKELDCALREFEEETGISHDYVQVIYNIKPFEEIFIGSNLKSYKHKYFVAKFVDNDGNYNDNTKLINFQPTEVSKVEWKTFDNAYNTIRPYNYEKKTILENLHQILQKCNTIDIDIDIDTDIDTNINMAIDIDTDNIL